MARSNKEQTERTRADLVVAGRKLFVERGYADTATPDIVAEAGVTRGALYHHFADKKALFRAVVEHEATQVADEINAASPTDLGLREMLIAGGEAFLVAMRAPGRTRLLLLDGPAVLGRATMDAIDRETGGATLVEGLTAAVQAGALPADTSVEATAALLSAAFDRAALAIDGGADAGAYRRALRAMIAGVMSG